jgi:hypothetical protein
MIRWSEKAKNLSRRRFLLTAGGAALAVPLLSSLPFRYARGARPPRRLVVFWTPDGFERGLPIGWNSTSPVTPTFAKGSVLEPLTPYKNDLLMIEKLHLHGQGGTDTNVHFGMRQLLTGALYSAALGGGPAGGYASLDQYLGKKLRGETKYPSLEVGVNSTPSIGTDYGRLSYQDGGVPVARENDPHAVWKRIFLNLFFDPKLADQLYAEQKSVLDATYGDLKAIMSQVGVDDRAKLEAHAEAYRDLEKALAPVQTSCVLPTEPAQSVSDYLKVGQLHIKLVAMALACDLLRVATIQWSFPVNSMPASFVGLSESSHNLGHRIGDNWQAKLMSVQKFYAQRFAELLTLLGGQPEGDGTLLRNSAVLWASELDDQPQNHSVAHMAVLMAGQAGGYFRTGRVVDGKMRYLNDLLISLGNAMGVDLPNGKYGDPSLCTGEISELR